MTEIWKDIPGYEGSYQVSDLGRVKSLPRQVVRKGKPINWFIGGEMLKPWFSGRMRYPAVYLCREGITWACAIHIIVATVFIAPAEKGLQVNHKDGDVGNPAAANLYWGTSSRNQQDRIKHGTYQYGEKNGSSKLTKEEVLAIREDPSPHRNIADRYGISPKYVGSLKNRKRWSHV